MWANRVFKRGLHDAGSIIDGRPLVLLLGWLGAQERHLLKYARVYEDFGASVATWRPSLYQTAIPTASTRAAAAFAASVAASSEGRSQAPVLVHAMSNAGWLAMGSLLRLAALEKQDMSATSVVSFAAVLARLRGVVVDSAPSHATPNIWARGTLAAALNKSAAGIEEEHPVGVRAAATAAERYLALPSISRHLRETRAAWGQLSLNVPQLYLYSVADPLIPASDVASFAMQQARRGAAVATHCWDDSGHCEHLLDHPEQYKRIVHSFMERCLTDVAAAANAM